MAIEQPVRARLTALLVAITAALGLALPQAGVAHSHGTAAQGGPLPSVRVIVAGDPTPIETLRLAILAAARAVIPKARDAEITLTQTAPPLQPLPAASGTVIRAAVQVTTPGLTPITRAVRVEIAHASHAWADAQVLLVSNNPEAPASSQVLFNGTLISAQPVRLLYHHQNATTRQMVIAVLLSNPASTRATLWVTGAGSNSGSDELIAGHEAARAFLDQYWHHAGFLLQIPARATVPLFMHALSPQAVASGITQLALVEGGHLNLQVVARSGNDAMWPTEGNGVGFDTVHQRGAFERPQLVRPLEYTVGGPVPMATVGDGPDLIHERHSGVVLQGNYGVIYTFPIRVTNPTSGPARLALVMHATGGQAGAMFLVDGQILDTPYVKSEAVQTVTTMRLDPGSQRTVMISTMPESGANYPVRLTLEPQGTLPPPAPRFSLPIPSQSPGGSPTPPPDGPGSLVEQR